MACAVRATTAWQQRSALSQRATGAATRARTVLRALRRRRAPDSAQLATTALQLQSVRLRRATGVATRARTARRRASHPRRARGSVHRAILAWQRRSARPRNATGSVPRAISARRARLPRHRMCAARASTARPARAWPRTARRATMVRRQQTVQQHAMAHAPRATTAPLGPRARCRTSSLQANTAYWGSRSRPTALLATRATRAARRQLSALARRARIVSRARQSAHAVPQARTRQP